MRELEKDRKREEKKHNEGIGKCNQKKNGNKMRKFGTKKKEDFKLSLAYLVDIFVTYIIENLFEKDLFNLFYRIAQLSLCIQ